MASMNEQQIIFYAGKKRINFLEKKKKEKGLTVEEQLEIDEIRQMLFENVVRFGISLAHKRMGKYRKDMDAFQDIQQDLAVIFYDKLPMYDPTKSTPTTFYLRYFNQVITEYILKYSQHMSQYDAHNVSIVRAAIKYYEEQGIKWDEPMIVTKTGLSPKVVKNTLRMASNSIMANIDDALDMASNIPTPEENYMQNEKTSTLYRVLQETLSEEELNFFFYKVNLDGKERSYQQVADGLGMQVRDVKKKWSSIIARLNANRELQSYGHPRSRNNKIKINLRTEPAKDFDEDLFFSGLNSVKLHTDEEEKDE